MSLAMRMPTLFGNWAVTFITIRAHQSLIDMLDNGYWMHSFSFFAIILTNFKCRSLMRCYHNFSTLANPLPSLNPTRKFSHFPSSNIEYTDLCLKKRKDFFTILYLSFKPVPMTTNIAMDFQLRNRSHEELKTFHRGLLFPRMVEEKMLKLLRQGKISKWFSGIGQEAISVGCTLALKEDEYIFTMHRNLGVFTTRKLPLSRLIAQSQGKVTGYTQGRDRSFHFGSPSDHIVGMISHLGPQLSLANGVALAHTLQDKKRVVLAFTGEGGTSEGEFHEALNVAAVWSLPVIFIIENNGYGLSTPTQEQYVCEHLVDRAKGYGMKGLRIDGNNVLEVYDTIRQEAEHMRENPRPVLIECDTFRMRGHEEASGTKYVPQELFDYWEQRDPLKRFEGALLEEGVLDADEILEIRQNIKGEIETAVQKGFAEPDPTPSIQKEIKDVYAPFTPKEQSPGTETENMRLVDAISDGLREGMRKHDKLVLMGQDIADYGGVFKITDGFLEEFGAGRVRNTPLCESAIIGAALGLSLEGQKSMVEMQFADFVTVG